MRKENVMGLNEEFVLFVVEVVKNEIKNKEEIEKVYSDMVGLKFENMGRVYSRVMRDELKEVREEIFKENGINESEFIEVGEMIKEMIGDEKRKYRWISY